MSDMEAVKPTFEDVLEGEKRFYAIRRGAYPRRVDMMAQIVCLERQLDLLDMALTSKNESVIQLQKELLAARALIETNPVEAEER